MLFIILLVIAILCGYLIYYDKKHDIFYSDMGIFFYVLSLLYLIFFITIHGIFGIRNIYNMTPLGKDKFQIKYENLKTYKNNDYIVPDIIEWNKDVTFGKKYAHNFWIGPYVSNIYDNLKTIE